MIKLQILILDEVMAIREGVVSILKQIPQIDSITVCESTKAALAEIAVRPYNIALIDLQLGKENGILLGRELLKLKPDLKVIIYTSETSVVIAAEVYRHEYLRQPSRHNVLPISGLVPVHNYGTFSSSLSVDLHGYTLLRNITPESFQRNLETLKRHGSFIDPEILDLLVNRLHHYRLTPRELQCSEMISSGNSNREISEELGITRQAVENLINGLYHKLSITGEPKDPGRRVLLALAMQWWRGLNKHIS